jgi:hypothetical protein
MAKKDDEEFVEEAEERLQHLEDEIAEARRHEKVVEEGSFSDEEADRFSHSGDVGEDDETIAPG